MLTSFKNFMRRSFHQNGQQGPTVIKTLVCYQRGGQPFVTEILGGPGGYLFLTDDECNKILLEIDVRMYIGELLGELTPSILENSVAFAQILANRNIAANSAAPSFS